MKNIKLLVNFKSESRVLNLKTNQVKQKHFRAKLYIFHFFLILGMFHTKMEAFYISALLKVYGNIFQVKVG